MTPKLTLNYGIRYELPFAWRSADDQDVTFSPGFQSRVIPSAPVSLGYEGDPFPGNATVRSRFNNVAPRFGFAYDVNGNGSTLIRGGMGIFFDALNAAVIGVGSPFHYQRKLHRSAGRTYRSRCWASQPSRRTTPKRSTSFDTPPIGQLRRPRIWRCPTPSLHLPRLPAQNQGERDAGTELRRQTGPAPAYPVRPESSGL